MTDMPLPPDAPEESPLPACIGVAHMRDDGTIEMHLRAEAPDGAVGEAVFVYAPDDLRYDSILAHVGPMSPGDQVEVKPFSA